MKTVRCGLAAALLLASAWSMAAETFQASEMLRRFDACDGSFFSYLALHRSELQALAPLSDGPGAATFRVEDRQGEETAYVAFRHPVEVDGIRLLGYTDSVTDLQILGMYYSWGFITDQTVDQLGAFARQHLPQGKRLNYVAADQLYVRSDRRVQGGDWLAVQDVAAESGKAVGLGAVERLQMVEAGTAAARRIPAGRSEIVCSLQGAVDDALLRQSRPDLNK